MKPCPSCSAPVRHDSTFCTKCGFKIDPSGADPLATAVGQIGASLPTGQFAAGAVIDGKYKVDRILGEGGMGMVYLAKSIHTDVDVVIKAVRPEIAHRADVRERTLAEGKALARIDHPNVVQLKSVVVTGKELLLVMQYIEGENLEDRILRHAQKNEPMQLGEALKIFRQILQGVAAAHAEGVIHRDIKPANVLIRAKDQVVKVTDFGIAKPEEDAQEGKGQTKGIIGTVNYMSPEQVTGRRDLDRRVDIYALGIVLFEMLTGLLPFDADNTYEIMKMHVDDPLPSATVGRPHLPPIIDGVLQRACAKDREHRYADCEEFLAALEGMEEAVSGMAATAMGLDGVAGVKATVPEAPSIQLPVQPVQPTPSPQAAAQFVSAVAQGHAVGAGYPAAGHPAAGHPAAGHPAAGHPAAGHPGAGHPGAGHPGTGYPAQGHTTQPSPQRQPITEQTPYGAPHPGYASAHTAQRHGTITGQAAELPASQVSGGRGWVIPVVLASLLASGVTVALVVGVGPFSADETTTEEADDEPRKKKKKKPQPAASTTASAAAASPLASMEGEWASKESQKRLKAVLIGDHLEFQIVDAEDGKGQNYLVGEARFVLRVKEGEPNRFMVEDRVRPLAPSGGGRAPSFSPASRSTCLASFTEVEGAPLEAELNGNNLDVDVVLVGPKASSFQIVNGVVQSCSNLKSGLVKKREPPLGFQKADG